MRNILKSTQPDPVFYFEQSPGNFDFEEEKSNINRLSLISNGSTVAGIISLYLPELTSGTIGYKPATILGIGMIGGALINEVKTQMPLEKKTERLLDVEENVNPVKEDYSSLFYETDVLIGKSHDTEIPEIFVDEKDLYLELAEKDDLGPHYHVRHPSGYEIWADVKSQSDYAQTESASLGFRGVNRILGH